MTPNASGAGESSHADGNLAAAGCVDLRRSSVVVAWAKNVDARRVLELAAHAASQLFLPTRLRDGDDPDGAMPREAVIVSDSAIFAFARCARQPERVMVGMTPGDGNLALLLASVRTMEDALGGAAP